MAFQSRQWPAAHTLAERGGAELEIREGGTMGLTYHSGESIRKGDRVTYGGNVGTIELVVEGVSGDPETDWLFANHGAGIMVVEPVVVGRVYLSEPHDEEDLVLVARVEP